LSIFDATSIIVGIIIGAGIYETTPLIAANTGSLTALIAVWLFGGFLAVVGALCYAELATTYPEDGGDYVYLKRAYGRRMAFLFAWAELWIVRPGSIGAMAFIFARYANEIVPLGDARQAFAPYAAGSIIVLTGINIVGVKEGKWTQNLLTAAKVVGLLTVFAVAFSGSPAVETPTAASEPRADYRLALILVLFTYGGWSEVAYVAAEVRNAKRNILSALLWGVGIVICVYVLANLAFASALGFAGLQHSSAAAADVLRLHFGEAGANLISLLICISTLGAINGQIFTGARIYYALGKDHPLFGRLGRWNARLGTPVWSLAVQATATLAPVLAFGGNPHGFRRLVEFNAPVYWLFFLLVGVAVFVLANRDVDRSRPFQVPAYPWTPLLFCLMCGWMCYASFTHAYEERSRESLWAIAILAAGLLVSFVEQPKSEVQNPTAEQI
jgi:amino acid transporter